MVLTPFKDTALRPRKLSSSSVFWEEFNGRTQVRCGAVSHCFHYLRQVDDATGMETVIALQLTRSTSLIIRFLGLAVFDTLDSFTHF